MPVPKWLRAEQTTVGSGTGTLTLISGDTSRRQLESTVGAAQPVMYVIHSPGTAQWEQGVGTFNDGTPGTLTRSDSNVLAGSSGPGARVNFAPGTKNVFLVGWPGAREMAGFASSATLALADLGSFLEFTGSADATLSLPAAAGLPRGIGTRVFHGGAAGTVLSIDPSGAELINGESAVRMMPGEDCEIFVSADGTGWRCHGLTTGLVLIERKGISGTPGTVTLPVPLVGADYQVHWRGVNFSADAQLNMRVSTDGGATFDSGASDYSRVYAWQDGAGAWNMGNSLGADIFVTDVTAAGSWKSGSFDLFSGTAVSHARVTAGRATFARPSAGALVEGSFAGGRAATASVAALQFRPSTGTFTAGEFAIYLRR